MSAMASRKDPLDRLRGRIDWLELVTGFACNCRCRVCSSGLLQGAPGLSAGEMASWLARARKLGATKLWLGGGEPTLHDDLLRTIGLARHLGYETIRLQTNGLRLAYPSYVDALVRAGLTEAALSVMGWDAKSHDGMTQRGGTWDLMARAVDNVRAAGVRLEADILLTKPILPRLPGLVDALAERGVQGVTLWLVSLHGTPEGKGVERLVPALGRLRAALRKAFATAEARGLPATSLHTPPCSLAPEDRGRYRHSGKYRLLVVVPGNAPFLAEESPMEGGEHPGATCDGCAARDDCLGLRSDQLRLFGTAGLQPLRGAARKPGKAARPRRRSPATKT